MVNHNPNPEPVASRIPVAKKYCGDCGALPGYQHQLSCEQVPVAVFREVVQDLASHPADPSN